MNSPVLGEPVPPPPATVAADPVALIARLDSLPGCDAEVASLLEGFAVEVAAEPGNIVFAPHRTKADPGCFVVYEVYRDGSAFRTHLASQHTDRFNERVSLLLDGGRSRLDFLAPLDGGPA